jgi:hypothetical protein
MPQSELEPCILANLAIIASLKPGDKLNTTTPQYYIDTSSYYQCIIRYYYGSNRTSTIDNLQALITAVTAFIGKIGADNIVLLLHPPDHIGNKKRLRRRRHRYRALRRLLGIACINSICILHKILDGAVNGLTNLAETYKTDAVCYDNLVKMATLLATQYAAIK